MQQANKTLVVIGGGAAGFFCAVNAAKLNPQLKVIILEKTNKVLSKVKVSGGGRCNVTHNCFDINELSKKYPRGEKFLKKAFHWFNVSHTIDWFKERGVDLKTEADGRMFAESNTSQTIIDCLIKEANIYNVEIRMNNAVESIEKRKDGFELQLNQNTKKISTDYICIACGGYPKTAMFNWLTVLGHSIQNPVPSLFTFNIPNNAITKFMGLSITNASVKIVGSKWQTQGAVLITHWGLSGPAILKLSAFAARDLSEKEYNFSVVLNWISQTEQQVIELFAILRKTQATQKLVNKNSFNIPTRLWNYFLEICNIDEKVNWSSITTKQTNALAKTLVTQVFEVKGKTTFKEEFVTCGGIKLNEVEVNTMQSKIVKNLFFAGEILDIDGITGGFNFQNAWTTGYLVAKSIAQLS